MWKKNHQTTLWLFIFLQKLIWNVLSLWQRTNCFIASCWYKVQTVVSASIYSWCGIELVPLFFHFEWVSRVVRSLYSLLPIYSIFSFPVQMGVKLSFKHKMFKYHQCYRLFLRFTYFPMLRGWSIDNLICFVYVCRTRRKEHFYVCRRM